MQISKKRLAAIVVISLMVGGGIGSTHPQPNCPTEDSCTAQYYDHAWHIVQVTP